MFHSAQLFITAAQKLNITILVSTSFATGTTNLTSQMKTIKQSQAQIILFIGTILDQQVVIDNSLIVGLTGVGYQWIGLHASMYKALYLNSTGGKVQQYYEWSQGLIGLQNFADINSNIYKEYAQRWSTTPYDPETSTIDPNSISPIANFAYDACFMFAHALHHMIEVLQLDPMEMENRERFLAVLKNVTFLGVSGHVRVDENGDRLAPFDIVNFQHDQIVKIGSITVDGQVSYLPQINIMYTGNTETKPHDLPVRPLIKISRSILIGMTGGSVVCTMLCLISITFTCYFKQHPVVKASSATFLVLMLVGIMSLAISVIPRTLETYRQSSALCISELWLANIGYSLVIGTLLVSNLYFIFKEVLLILLPAENLSFVENISHVSTYCETLSQGSVFIDYAVWFNYTFISNANRSLFW